MLNDPRAGPFVQGVLLHPEQAATIQGSRKTQIPRGEKKKRLCAAAPIPRACFGICRILRRRLDASEHGVEADMPYKHRAGWLDQALVWYFLSAEVPGKPGPRAGSPFCGCRVLKNTETLVGLGFAGKKSDSVARKEATALGSFEPSLHSVEDCLITDSDK